MTDLCKDVWIEILSFLPLDVIRKTVKMVSKFFSKLIYEQGLWKHIVKRRFKYFYGKETKALQEIHQDHNCDWINVFHGTRMDLWEEFHEGEEVYQGLDSYWGIGQGEMFFQSESIHNNYYIEGPHWIDKIFCKGRHGCCFRFSTESIQDQKFGFISLKDHENEDNEKVKTTLRNIKKETFRGFDYPRPDGIPFTLLDFYGFSPLTGRKIHNKEREDIIGSDGENLSEKYRKKLHTNQELIAAHVILLIDLGEEVSSMKVIVNGDDYGEVFSGISGPVVPVIFPFSDDSYVFYAIF